MLLKLKDYFVGVTRDVNSEHKKKHFAKRTQNTASESTRYFYGCIESELSRYELFISIIACHKKLINSKPCAIF